MEGSLFPPASLRLGMCSTKPMTVELPRLGWGHGAVALQEFFQISANKRSQMQTEGKVHPFGWRARFLLWGCGYSQV